MQALQSRGACNTNLKPRGKVGIDVETAIVGFVNAFGQIPKEGVGT